MASSVYLFNKHFRTNKRVYTVLLRFHGIGRTRAAYLLGLIGITKRVKLKRLSLFKIELLSFYLHTCFIIERRLRKNNTFFLYRINVNGCYKSLRYKSSLPANGQRTHTNASTSRLARGRLVVLNLRIK